MKPLRYFFFRMHKLAIKQGSPVPWLRPLALLSVLTGSNVMIVVSVFLEFRDDATSLAHRESILKAAIVLWTALMFAALYARWIKNDRYLAFENEFGNESSAAGRIRAVLLFAYGIASICSPAIVGYWLYLGSP